MDAIQLALYGKLAETSNRGSLPYNDYLDKCIHSSVPRDEGASVGITFRYASDGLEHKYNVRRLWKGTTSGMREQVQVSKDGARDRLLEENWAEFVETLLPNRVAQLFFFDGERVEALANPDTASEVLSTAIHALLGLDLVDRLTTDLQVLERRKKIRGARRADRESVRQLESELDETRQELDTARQERASARAEMDRTTARLRECNDRLRHEGADIAERREALEAETTRNREELHRLHRELEAVAYGALPLSLVRPALREVQRQSELETKAETARMIDCALRERNASLLAWLGSRPRSKKLTADVQSYLKAEMAERGAAEVVPYLELSGTSRSQLDDILSNRLSNELRTRDELLGDVDTARAHLDELERTLAALPAPESLAPLLEERAVLESRLSKLESKHSALEEAMQQLVRLARKSHQGGRKRLLPVA
jgi:DNA sulfur modification protein DndD